MTSSCAASESCVEYQVQGAASSWVCMPALAAGAPCEQDGFCPNGHICGAVNGGAFLCRPTCATAGAACGTNGTCVSVGAGCSFCSSF